VEYAQQQQQQFGYQQQQDPNLFPRAEGQGQAGFTLTTEEYGMFQEFMLVM